MQTAVSMATAL
uniref:Uncharacterized protein n=1 Tax=Anguilla anguilla TaxID=7936 RepID=A0A0E9VYF6_ANGAN